MQNLEDTGLNLTIRGYSLRDNSSSQFRNLKVIKQFKLRGHSGNHVAKFGNVQDFFFSVNTMNNNVKLFFSFIRQIIMYTEQFFKYTVNCVFQCYLELKIAPLKIRRERFQLTDSFETKKPN